MFTSTRMWQLAAVLIAIHGVSESQAQTVDEIIVTADFRDRAVSELPASVTVFDADEIRTRAVQHFEELVNAVPNLNWSGDGNRARYFQIRGAGELEQYQGAPNPSVGFLIDDIDYSGIGTVATLFDLQQVEVLRGPQGTRYGANALAGLIYMQSAQPTAHWDGRVQLTAGDDGVRSAGIAVGGPLKDDKSAMFRFSAHHHESNGFRRNPFLNRDDTNGRDETTLRGRLLWLANDDWSVSVAAMAVDVDDGYDAFALDNSYTVLSDKPGRDAQESLGASVRVERTGSHGFTFTSITTAADSDIDFSFDADWGNEDAWAPITYDFVSLNDRKRSTISQEFRLATSAWLIGLYAQELQDELVTLNQGEYFDPLSSFADSLDDTFESDYDARNIALFGQYDHDLGPATRFSVGLRVERRTTDYLDSSGLAVAPAETMSGGALTLHHRHSGRLTSYASVSKGYKAGGVNLGEDLDNRREFAAEKLWNVEIGMKSVLFDNTLRLNAAVFYSRHDDQQVRTSFQLVQGDPTTFVFFTDNVAKGKTRGIEADVQWYPNDVWMLYGNIGLLDASFDEFVTPQVDLSGRRQAHAPAYTLAVGARYRHATGFFARLDLTARDEFFFDVSHDQKSKSYELANLRAGYERGDWTLQLWVRNVFDTAYAVRGFYFGNEPPDFLNTLYTRLGDPRQVGITIDKTF